MGVGDDQPDTAQAAAGGKPRGVGSTYTCDIQEEDDLRTMATFISFLFADLVLLQPPPGSSISSRTASLS